MSKKKSPFDYVKGINEKNYQGDDLKGYVPYLTNRAFAMHMDTVLLAEEMNQAHQLGPELQYDFYYHAVRKGRRFGFPKKPEATPFLEAVQEYYGYSKEKAEAALRLLTEEQVRAIIKTQDLGGNS